MFLALLYPEGMQCMITSVFLALQGTHCSLLPCFKLSSRSVEEYKACFSGLSLPLHHHPMCFSTWSRETWWWYWSSCVGQDTALWPSGLLCSALLCSGLVWSGLDGWTNKNKNSPAVQKPRPQERLNETNNRLWECRAPGSVNRYYEGTSLIFPERGVMPDG